jgi:hypothetical protein
MKLKTKMLKKKAERRRVLSIATCYKSEHIYLFIFIFILIILLFYLPPRNQER